MMHFFIIIIAEVVARFVRLLAPAREWRAGPTSSEPAPCTPLPRYSTTLLAFSQTEGRLDSSRGEVFSLR